MYKQMPTCLSPEIMHFNLTKGATQDMYVKVCVHDVLQYVILAKYKSVCALLLSVPDQNMLGQVWIPYLLE